MSFYYLLTVTDFLLLLFHFTESHDIYPTVLFLSLSFTCSLSLHMYFFTSEREKDDPLNMERAGEEERQIVCGCEFFHLTKMLMCRVVIGWCKCGVLHRDLIEFILQYKIM